MPLASIRNLLLACLFAAAGFTGVMFIAVRSAGNPPARVIVTPTVWRHSPGVTRSQFRTVIATASVAKSAAGNTNSLGGARG
jgi:hypothetical protein